MDMGRLRISSPKLASLFLGKYQARQAVFRLLLYHLGLHK